MNARVTEFFWLFTALVGTFLLPSDLSSEDLTRIILKKPFYSPAELRPFVSKIDSNGMETMLETFHLGNGDLNKISLRINLRNEIDSSEFVIRFNYPLLDRIECWDTSLPDQKMQAGDHIPFVDWKIKDRLPAFPFHLLKNSKTTIECLIQTTSSFQIPFELHERENYLSIKQSELLKTGMYLGIFALLLVYNIGLYYYFRTFDYLFYLLYLIHTTFILLYSDGSLYEWVLFDYPGLAESLFPYFLISGVISLIMFTMAFLHLDVPRSNWKKLKNSLLLILIAPAMALFSIRQIDLLPILIPFPIIAVISLAVIAFRLTFQGNKAARVYLLSFAVFFFFILLHSLNFYGLIEDSRNTLTGLIVGGVIQNVLLSLAISEKINRLRLDLLGEMEDKIKSRTTYLNQTLQRMEKDLNTARIVQESFLPENIYWKEKIGLAAIYEPLGGVGGDLYDVLSLDEDRIRFWIADATGHGIRGALYTAAVRSDWESVRSLLESPAKVMDTFRSLYNKKYFELGLFLSCLCLDWDQKTNRITYVSFGHCEPIILSEKGNVSVLTAEGKVMGLDEKEGSIENSVHVEKGDRIMLFTDGLYEAFDDQKNIFGYENIFSYLFKNFRATTPELASGLLEKLKCFAKEGNLSDDVTLLVVPVPN